MKQLWFDFFEKLRHAEELWALFWNTFQLTNHRQTVGLNEL